MYMDPGLRVETTSMYWSNVTQLPSKDSLFVSSQSPSDLHTVTSCTRFGFRVSSSSHHS